MKWNQIFTCLASKITFQDRRKRRMFTSALLCSQILKKNNIFLAFDFLSVLCGHLLSQILSITFIFSYLNSWERASIFHFECSVLNKGTTGTIFITSLVWRDPWLGIEPGTSRTRGQHYTTRLSRRRSLTGDWTRDLPHSKPALNH